MPLQDPFHGDNHERADVVRIAVAHPRFLTAGFVRERAVVTDIGVLRQRGILGDVDHQDVGPEARLITPVPGAVGPVTTPMIMLDVVKCASNRP